MIRLVPQAETVKVTFVLPVHAVPGRCSVVGDFNGWQPGRHELRRRSNGTRSTSVAVPRGTRIRFRYLAQDGHWFNDPELIECEGQDNTITV